MSTRLEMLLAERERRRAARAQAGAAPQAAPQSSTRLDALLAERERRRAAREQQAAQPGARYQQSSELAQYEAPESVREGSAYEREPELLRAVRLAAVPRSAYELAPEHNSGRAPALAAGAVQGATFGFGDELAGIGSVKLENLFGGPSEIAQAYRWGRDRVRRVNAAQQQEHPGYYLGGEIAGGILTSLIPGAGAARSAKAGVAALKAGQTARAAAKAGKTLAIGAGSGAAASLGASDADLTRGEFGGSARDTAIGGGLGAGMAALGMGGAKVAQGVARLAKGGKGATQTAVKKVAALAAKDADQLDDVTFEATKRDYYRTSRELEKEGSEAIKEKYQFTPSQATGNRELALRERKARNFPGTMNAAQGLEAKQQRQAGRVLEAYTDKVAANPELLGTSAIDDQVSGAIQRQLSDIVSERSKAVRPFYSRFNAAGGDRVVLSDAIKTVEDEIRKLGKGASESAADRLKQTLRMLKEEPTLDNIHADLKYWTGASRASDDALGALSPDAKVTLARTIRGAIDDNIDTFAQSGEGEAFKALRQGRVIWKQYSQEFDETATETVKRMLNLASTDQSDEVVDKLVKVGDNQIRGVFRILNKADPAAASNLRAQLLENVFVASGKPARGPSFTGEAGIAKISPLKAIRNLVKVDSMLVAAFDGDPKAQWAVKRSLAQLQRLNFGPNVHGSITASQQATAITEAGEAVAGGVVGGAAGREARAATSSIASFIKSILGNEKAQAKVYTEPATIDLFNQVLDQQLAAQAGKPYSLAPVISLSNALGLQVGDITK